MSSKRDTTKNVGIFLNHWDFFCHGLGYFLQNAPAALEVIAKARGFVMWIAAKAATNLALKRQRPGLWEAVPYAKEFNASGTQLAIVRP